MTQKELSYVEDAINHESNMINILEESIAFLKDEKLVTFFEDEIKNHEELKNKLIKKLGSKCNE